MPFLEGVFYLILIGVGLLALYWLAIGFAVAFAAVFFGTLCLGWIPILMCASDPDMFIRWDNAAGFWGFFERWAFLSMLEYSGASMLVFIIAFARPDPDGLPPGWKFLALFYVPRAAKIARAATTKGVSFEPEAFTEAVDDMPPTAIGKRMEARRFQQTADQIAAEAQRLEKATKLAEASIKLDLLKAEQEALEEFVKKHGK